MKKAVLASAVIAVIASGSTLAATVYDSEGTELKVGGRVEFRGDFIGSKGAEVEGTMEDKSRARLNLKGKTDLNDDLTGFAVYEAEQGTGKDSFENRYMYAGLETGFGEFSAGRQDTAAVLITDLTDISEFSGLQQYIDAASDKEDSTFAYRGKFDALQLQASFTANNESDSDGFGLAALYALPMGLDLGAAYSKADLNKDYQQSSALFGAAYSLDALYLAITYSFGDNDNLDQDTPANSHKSEFTALEAAVAYKFTDQITAKLVYGKAEDENTDAKTKADSADFFEVVGYYKFNGNLSSYVSYMSNGLKEVKDADGVVVSGEDTLRLGIKYGF
ncbi:Outer membrane protein [Vibrio sinaloensis DSM 21326]|uniref:Outer membrane protein n=1 Tax=Vibrio sinaloensis DSM 21326 TaxID=945550 RepID=E8MBC2_PHOS4|nr:porin [Vibrio sinaloensis]EGA68705.1 Outer membrane protein [Vibrio sinaloensis DSM 21326]